jgi:hypothetical protein
MFKNLFKKKTKSKFQWNEKTIEPWQQPFEYLIKKFDNLVKCDVCGCLLEKQDAIRGKSTVEEVYYMYGINYWVSPQRPMKPQDEIIVKHYYCKVHGKGKNGK